jgi:DNA polymerase-3 subunit gamma/tau
VDAPLALYRRYRPETFAEVIGQEHITAPLQHALEGNRVHHAYLFSGPRGCGKTTSARILARALNCAEGPAAEPCGKCDSCVSLARGGPGSMDVIEIDAASHGGVDDARDLRERAFFAPVDSRYKVYIIDEAHMVSTQGFNALLKLVEEPPPHLKFIFATTEPEKVIGTIKSRTHHYPFRLVPPKLLGGYVADVCRREGVPVEPAVLPLVVRAGGGSVRDTLSVLDQLIGGAGPDGVTYAGATGLLGYTPESMLDEVVEAFAVGDAGTVFGVVDRVIETGQDPRRFGEDLLRRLRDLVIVSAVPGAVAKGIVDAPADHADRLNAQAARFGPAELTRAADVVSQGLTDMRGATAPRLLLELICARVMLPSSDHSTEGVHARLDRIERRMAIGGTVSAERDPEAQPTAPVAPALSAISAGEGSAAGGATAGGGSAAGEGSAAGGATAGGGSAAGEGSAAGGGTTGGESTAEGEGTPEGGAARAPGRMTLVDLRRSWPDVLESVKQKRRFTWVLLSQNAQVSAFDGTTVTVGMSSAGARDSFVGRGSDEILRQALIDVLGIEARVEAIVDGGSAAPSPPRGEQAKPAPQPPPASDPASGAISAGGGSAGADPDDPTVPDDGGHDELLVRELGAEVIEEIRHD